MLFYRQNLDTFLTSIIIRLLHTTFGNRTKTPLHFPVGKDKEIIKLSAVETGICREYIYTLINRKRQKKSKAVFSWFRFVSHRRTFGQYKPESRSFSRLRVHTILPPIALTMLLHIGSPRPVPCLKLSNWTKRSNIWLWFSFPEYPQPVSFYIEIDFFLPLSYPIIMLAPLG